LFAIKKPMISHSLNLITNWFSVKLLDIVIINVLPISQ
jgi:hypothetical protein